MCICLYIYALFLEMGIHTHSFCCEIVVPHSAYRSGAWDHSVIRLGHENNRSLFALFSARMVSLLWHLLALQADPGVQ